MNIGFKDAKLIKMKSVLSSFLMLFLILFSSCENNIAEVNTLTKTENRPIESAKDVEVIYSDSALVKIKLISKQLDKYAGEDPFVEFPKGLKVYFYNRNLKVESELSANYAIRYEKKNLMEAKKDVVVINEKGEKLNTEHLIWDEKKQKIYSDAFVKITTADEVIFGEGFEAEQDFSKYRINKIKGTINLKEE